MKKCLALFLSALIVILLSACDTESDATPVPEIILPTESSTTQTNKEKDTLHEHEFSKATCTEAARCECGKRDGSALGHRAKNGVCMICGEKVKEIATTPNTSGGSNAHTHTFSQATCTQAPKCSCGQTNGSALGHNLVNGTCSVCGAKPAYNIGNVLILGDSISTFEGYIPQGNATYYNTSGGNPTGVNSVDQTWWKIFEKNTGANIVLNESFSGTTICNTGYHGNIVPLTSFIGRFDKLVNNGYFNNNKIDTVIIFGGTNDSWAGSPVGTPKYSDWTDNDKLSFLPAFCYLINSIQKTIPNAKIVCIINDGLSGPITDGMKGMCQKYNVDYVALNGISKSDGHPDVNGMIQLEQQLRSAFEKIN